MVCSTFLLLLQEPLGYYWGLASLDARRPAFTTTQREQVLARRIQDSRGGTTAIHRKAGKRDGQDRGDLEGQKLGRVSVRNPLG